MTTTAPRWYRPEEVPPAGWYAAQVAEDSRPYEMQYRDGIHRADDRGNFQSENDNAIFLFGPLPALHRASVFPRKAKPQFAIVQSSESRQVHGWTGRGWSRFIRDWQLYDGEAEASEINPTIPEWVTASPSRIIEVYLRDEE